MKKQKDLEALYFDPWHIMYSKEMNDAMSKKIKITLVTHTKAEDISDRIEVKDYFFPYSNKFNKDTKCKKMVKGLEYIVAWKKIIKLVSNKYFDIFHIQWLLSYPIDLYFLKKIKSKSKNPDMKIIYTAHNATPHVKGETAKKRLQDIYGCVDQIIVHGEATKKEIVSFVPEVEKNIYIQKHGAFKFDDIEKKHSFSSVKSKHKNMIQSTTGLKLLFLGNIFHNKGADRLMDFWYKNNSYNKEHLLIVAGGVREKTNDYALIENKFRKLKNVIYCDYQVNDEEHDYFFSNCDIVILPYRHASMSGVVFTASKFKKPILTTKVGCIPDYLIHGENSLIVENEDGILYSALNTLLGEYSKSQLEEMGENLNTHISKTCAWDKICNKLITDAYS